jgi:hypothetical protein
MTRSWCAKACYSGCEPFIFGSVMLPADAKFHEVEAALLALWKSISPHPAPRIEPVPGLLVFQEHEA